MDCCSFSYNRRYQRAICDGASSVVKALAEQGQQRLGSQHKAKLAASLNKPAVPKSRRKCRCRASQKKAKANISGEGAVAGIQRICRGKECDTNRKMRGVNWGSSATQARMGIKHKLIRRLRVSDVAIVSQEPVGQHDRWGAKGHWMGGVIRREWCRRRKPTTESNATSGESTQWRPSKCASAKVAAA